MLEKNLIIVVFEGVLGAYQRTEVWSTKRPKLHLRETALKALAKLLSSFQVVLFFLQPTTKVKPTLKLFETAGVKFDGVYRSNAKWEFGPYTQNYDQVLADFHMDSSQAVVLAPVQLTDADFKAAKGTSAVLHRNGRRLCDIHV